MNLCIVAPSYKGPNRNQSFTLRAYSNRALTFTSPQRQPLPYSCKIDDGWSGRSAGGNHTLPTFMDNPQYTLAVTSRLAKPSALSAVTVALKAPTEVSVNVKVVRGRNMVSLLHPGDVIADSGPYNHGHAVCNMHSLRVGSYVIICSTFGNAQEADFSLRIQSSEPASLASIPAEGAGMFSRTLKGKWNANRISDFRTRYFLRPSSNPAAVLLRLQAISRPPLPSIKVTIERDGTPVFDSGNYTDAICGITTGMLQLPPFQDFVINISAYPSDIGADFRLLAYGSVPFDIGIL